MAEEYTEILEDKLDSEGKVTEVSVLHRHPSFPTIRFIYEQTQGQTGDYLIVKTWGTRDAKREVIDTAYTPEEAIEALYEHALASISGDRFKYRRNGQESETILHPEELKNHMLKRTIAQNIAKLVNINTKRNR